MISLTVNGKAQQVDVDPDVPLLWVVRENLNLTGTKYGCGIAQCGACTVHVDGQPRRSCVAPLRDLANVSVTTIEAIEATSEGKAVQNAWLDKEVPSAAIANPGRSCRRQPC